MMEEKKKRVYLALPRLGNPVMESTMAAFIFPSNDRLHVSIAPRSSSLLAHGFNQAWCDAINCEEPYDYFAMLHADVSPQGAWLDKLIDLLEASPYAVLHAPCAIKDGRGLTSTAVGPCAVRDRFLPVRRLTVGELQKLPPVFGYEDVCTVMGEPERPGWGLLPNTGCWVAKLADFPALDFPGFRIDDRVVWHNGKAYAQTAPEDWEFGRWCNRAGVRVGGCREVVTHHHGGFVFRSDDMWGEWKEDQTYLDAAKKMEEMAAAGISVPPAVAI